MKVAKLTEEQVSQLETVEVTKDNLENYKNV